MPNPCIIWGARILPATIIKEHPSISPRMNHVVTGSPTSARLFLSTSLALLKYYSPPCVKSQGALWQRHTACLPNTCSKSEMSCQSPTKAAPPLCMQENTRAKPMKPGWGQNDHAWVSAPNPVHVCLQTPQAVCPFPVHSVIWLTSRTLHPSELGWAKVPELAQAPAQAPASTTSQNGTMGLSQHLQCVCTRTGQSYIMFAAKGLKPTAQHSSTIWLGHQHPVPCPCPPFPQS